MPRGRKVPIMSREVAIFRTLRNIAIATAQLEEAAEAAAREEAIVDNREPGIRLTSHAGVTWSTSTFTTSETVGTIRTSPSSESVPPACKIARKTSGRKNNANQEHRDDLETIVTNRFRKAVCLKWFYSYCDRDEFSGPAVMLPAGLMKLAKDIKKDLKDIVFLVLAWKMEANQMGVFTEEEWLRGMTEFKVDTGSKLASKWEQLAKILENPDDFRAVYRFSYDFARDKDERHLDLETSKGLIKLFLGDRWSLCADFLNFLDLHPFKVMNKDQFNNVLEFQRFVKDDVSDYDLEGAWPVLMDDFVEYMRNHVLKQPNTLTTETDGHY